ncbi:MAG: DUF3822 family protein [Bacteroidia bacterium]|nr:DUF3822 family protein [Bacteroidia bacterium]
MFLPENIDLAQSEKYILSIRLTPDGFSFCIFLPSDPAVFHYHASVFSKSLSVIENIKKTFFEVNFFSHPFKETRVTVVSPKFTLTPDAYFDKKKAKDIYEFNIHGHSGRVLSNYIAEGSYHILFGLEEEVHSFLCRNLWNPSFFSHAAHTLPFFSRHRSQSNRCFVDFHDNMVSTACFSGENLLSANTYLTNDRFDALYNIANIWEKQSLNQNSDLLILSGDLANQKESVDTLKKLIKNVEELTITPKPAVAENAIPTDILLAMSDER